MSSSYICLASVNVIVTCDHYLLENSAYFYCEILVIWARQLVVDVYDRTRNVNLSP